MPVNTRNKTYYDNNDNNYDNNDNNYDNNDNNDNNDINDNNNNEILNSTGSTDKTANDKLNTRKRATSSSDDILQINKSISNIYKRLRLLENNINYDLENMSDDMQEMWDHIDYIQCNYDDNLSSKSNNKNKSSKFNKQNTHKIFNSDDEDVDDENDDENENIDNEENNCLVDNRGMTLFELIRSKLNNPNIDELSSKDNIKKILTKFKPNIKKNELNKELDLCNKFVDNKDNIVGELIKGQELEYYAKLSRSDKEAINNSINTLKPFQNDTPMLFKVLNSSINPYHKFTTLQKIKEINSSDSEDNTKLKQWVETIVSIPWNKYSYLPLNSSSPPDEVQSYLYKSRSNLDKVIYGQSETKDHIIQIISKMISNPKSSGNVFAIYGPPGTGKTTIIKEGMAKVLGIPFAFISLGGATDSSYLDGHSYTYVGSTPGKIVKELQQCSCMNPIFYFDELDKVSKSYKGDEIINLLIHLTDSSQNNHFSDKYLSGIPIDLSKSIFVFSFNDISEINKILLDRMDLIKVAKFDNKEKNIITRDYLLPDIYSKYAIQPDQVIFDEECIDYIVNFKGIGEKEQGVRNIKRRIENIIAKLNILYITSGNSDSEQQKSIHSMMCKIKDICDNDTIFPLKLSIKIIDILSSINTYNIDSNDSNPPFFMYS